MLFRSLGSFDVGDQVYFRARRGWLDVADYFRVVELGFTVGPGASEVTVTLAGAEAFG